MVVDNISKPSVGLPIKPAVKTDPVDETWALNLLSELEEDESIEVQESEASNSFQSPSALPNNGHRLNEFSKPNESMILSSDLFIDLDDSLEINAGMLELSAIENQKLLQALKKEQDANGLEAKNDSFFSFGRLLKFFAR